MISFAAEPTLTIGTMGTEMLNKEQRKALHRVWMRDPQGMTYLQFRRSVHWGYDCAMVRWCGMWLGIEKDGYTHS